MKDSLIAHVDFSDMEIWIQKIYQRKRLKEFDKAYLMLDETFIYRQSFAREKM